jgi:MFS family permease
MASDFKNFRFLVAGNAISAYGSFLNLIALNLYALSSTGSATQTGLIMALRLSVGFSMGFVSGAVVSRFNRKLVMVCGDLSQAIALTVLLAAPAGARPALLYAVAVVAGAGGTLSQVALRSSIPAIVGQDQRVRANAMLGTGRSLAMVAGFASAGIVVSAFGFSAAFAIDAATFVVSAANLSRLPLRMRSPGSGAVAGAAPQAVAGGWISPQIGFKVLRATPMLLVMIAIRAVDGFGSASHNVGLPVYSTALDPAHPAVFVSRFWAVWAVGNILMQRGLVRYLRRTGRSIGENAFSIGTILMSSAFIVAFTGPPIVIGVLVALVAGMADGFTDNAYASRLQTVSDEDRGYVFGFSSMAENLGFGSGMVVSALLLEHHSPLRVVAVSHGIAIACGVAFLSSVLLRSLRSRRVGAEELMLMAVDADPVAVSGDAS